MRDSAVSDPTPYVSAEIPGVIAAIRVQIDSLRANPQDNRSDLIRDLQTINHNIAYVGVLLDNDTAGITSSEGLLT